MRPPTQIIPFFPVIVHYIPNYTKSAESSDSSPHLRINVAVITPYFSLYALARTYRLPRGVFDEG